MRTGRTLPPAAAPLAWKNIWHGIAGLVMSERATARLEAELRREFGVAHVFLLSSGTAALALTLIALARLSARRDVVLPAFTCFSVPAAVLRARLRAVPCDIDAATFDFDQDGLERAMTADTLCVVAHHLFGVPSDIERIRARCRARGIFVVEDAAQAMGAEVNGRKLGTIGDVGIFSLGRGKHITCGAGGVIVTDSDRIAAAIDRCYRPLSAASCLGQVKALVRMILMTLFIRPRLYWIPAAVPFLRLGETFFPRRVRIERLGGVHAGLLHGWQNRLARANRARAATAAYFSRQWSLEPSGERPRPYLRFPVVVANASERARILLRSRKRGLGVSAAYPTAVNEVPELQPVCRGRQFPAARRVAETLLTVPTHHWLSDEDKCAIADLFRDAAARPAVDPPMPDHTPGRRIARSADPRITVSPA
jgi:perosamine synthetase